MTPGRRVKSPKSLISAVTAAPAAVTSAPQPGYATGSKGGAKWCDATAELESWTTQPAPSDAYRDQPARCAPAPFGSLVGDYGAVPAYAAAPSPPMRENNAESEPRATSPPDGTSARESPSLGPRLALGSLRGRAPRVVVDTVALRGPAVRTASSRS